MAEEKSRLDQIANALMQLGVVANWEEAIARAKEIVKEEGGGKTLKDLANEMQEESKESQKDTDSAKKTKEEVAKVKEDLKDDIKEHQLESGDKKEATKDLKDIECAVDDAEYIIGQSEKVQKAKKKKP